MSNDADGRETHDIWIPADISESVRSRVGRDGFSAYVAEAVAHRLARDAADDAEVNRPASNPAPARQSQ